MKTKIEKEAPENEEGNLDEQFQFEVASSDGSQEKIEELPEEVEQEPPRRKTIKILSEKDMEIKEIQPPNYSPYLLCFLHYKDSSYKKGRMLKHRKS